MIFGTWMSRSTVPRVLWLRSNISDAANLVLPVQMGLWRFLPILWFRTVFQVHAVDLARVSVANSSQPRVIFFGTGPSRDPDIAEDKDAWSLSGSGLWLVLLLFLYLAVVRFEFSV